MNELLSICIPTYNRANILNDCLKNLLPLAQKYEIPIYVSDNASTDHTEEVVSNLKKSYSHIYYSRNKENLKDLNYGLVLKMSKSKYAWLFNDKSRIKEESLKIILEQLKTEEYTLLILNTENRVTDISNPAVYTDRNKLLSELGWHMTMVSTTIWSKDMIEKGDFKKYLGSPFLQLQTLLAYLANNNFSAYWQPKPLFHNILLLSGWAKGKDSKIFDFFVEKWYQAIKDLPKSYSEEAKLACIKAHGTKSKLFSYNSFVRFRKAGQYNYKIYKQYKDYWPIITEVPKWKLFLVATLPPILV